MKISNLLSSLRNRKALIAASTCATLCLVLTGCGMGVAAPASNSVSQGVALHGIAHGGQQGIVGGAVQLWEAGGTSTSSTAGAGYGTGAISLISNPVFTGFNVASLTPGAAVTAYSVTSNVATFTTAANGLVAGEAVTLGGFANGTFFNGQTVTVLAAGLSSTQFEANFVNANTSGSEAAATATAATAGSFNITGDYTCHSGALVYLTITGGTAGVGNNSAIKLVAPLGLCSSLSSSTFININEVTTAAAAYALGNYYTTAGGIGAPATTQAQVGLTNAFATVNNLVSIATGAALTTFTHSNTGITSVAAVTVTGTPNAAKLYLIADMLAACVNSEGPGSPGCTTLFTNIVTPPTGGVTPPTPADIMQAAVDMDMNPTAGSTTKLGNLFALQTPQSPYIATAQSTTPNDLLVSIIYFPTASATSATGAPCVSAGTNFFMFYNFQLAVDANGNIWAGSNRSTAGTAANVSEISPTGAPLACVGAAAFTNCTGSSTTGCISGLTIDTGGNIWASEETSGGPIEEINPTTLALTAWGETGVAPGVASLVADGSGNVFYASSGAPLHEFTAAQIATATPGSTSVGSALTANSGGYYLAADSTGRIWTALIGGTGLFEDYLDPVSGTNGYSSASVATTINPQSQLGIDSSNKIWVVNSTGTNGNNIVAYTPNATNGSAATASFTSAAAVGGLAAGRGAAIDGAGNVWVPNSTTASVVVELSNAGAALSPTTGFVLPTNSTLRGPAIDPSGNVWIGTNATTVSNITEIVGAGVPVVTPISAAAAAGKLGQKP